MGEEIEMTLRPTGAQTVANQKASAEKRPDLERNVSVASDGRVRSRLQMFAILTALFVSQSGDLLARFPARLLTTSSAIIICSSIGRDHCRNSSTHHIQRPQLGSWVHMDRRSLPSCKCSVRADLG